MLLMADTVVVSGAAVLMRDWDVRAVLVQYSKSGHFTPLARTLGDNVGESG